jgi:hypothetical protein
MATCQVSHSCNLLTSRIEGLQRIVIGHDRDVAGGEVRSLAELGIRAQTLATLLLLDELHEAIRSNPDDYRGLFQGRLRSIEAVISFLFDSLARINHLWLRHRAPADGTPEPKAVEATRAVLYRSAIRCAQRAIVALGADPDLSHFLRAGSLRTDAPRVSRACAQLAAVLTVTLSRERDPALFLAAAVLEPDQLYDLTDDGDALTGDPRKP